MPDPAELPLELFEIILAQSLDFTDIRRLCELSSVNKGWHTILSTHAYNSWYYSGARKPFITLFYFVRTIRHNARIASMVEKLTVGNWGYFPWAVIRGPPPLIDIEAKDEDWIRLAVRETGIGDEEEILTKLSRRDRRPLMAILLASLPNLSILHAIMPLDDPYLAILFKNAMSPSSFLPKLHELSLYPEDAVMEEYNPGWEDEGKERILDYYSDCHENKLELKHLWPVFYKPNLRTLSLYEFDFKDATELLTRHMPDSRVENLSMVCHNGSCIGAEDLRTLLTIVGPLKKLSLYIPESPGASASDANSSPLSMALVWKYLRKHSSTLEFLDIYWLEYDMDSTNEPVTQLEEFEGCNLCVFPALKDIRLFYGMFMGVNRDSDTPMTRRLRLPAILPGGLSSLSLYEVELDHGDIPYETEGLLGGGTTSGLKSITFSIDILATCMGNYQTVQALCENRGIDFHFKKSHEVSRGGKFENRGPRCEEMADDSCFRVSLACLAPKSFRDMAELLLPEDEHCDDIIDREVDTDVNSEYEIESDSEYESDSDSTMVLADDPSVHVKDLKHHTIFFFPDHNGSTSYMIFQNRNRHPLPPLYSFAIYFTNAAVTKESALEDLILPLHEDLRRPNDNKFQVRYDMYILPSASEEDCMRHYRKEKISRGVYPTSAINFRSDPDPGSLRSR